MRDSESTDGRTGEMPGDDGLAPEPASADRRRHVRRQVRGIVEFHRPKEKALHAGTIADVSEGGLAFFTDVSLAVGETLLLTYREEGRAKSAEATVTTIHSRPREDSYLVGVNFAR